MKRQFLLTRLLLLFALIVGSGSVWATDVASFSRPGTSNTTTGGTFSATFAAKTGYYQDATGTCYLQILNNSAYWTTTPSSITLTSSIGGGSGNKDLSDDVYAVLLDSNGDEISSTATSITSHITTNTGDTYNTSIPVANNVYGIKIYHAKENNYNVRYFSFTLSYVAGSSNPTIAVNPTSLSDISYIQGNGPSATKTVSVSGSNLKANISLSLGESSNYEMCLTADGSYTNSLSLSPSNGTVSATNVYVRLKSGLTAGDKNGSITLTSTGATNATVNLTGSVTTLGVTYNDNGAGSGTAPTDATAYAYNAEVTVLGNTGSLTKEHNTFGGWNTQNDGEGTNYAAGDKFNITANTTLYAKWVINTNSVTLPDNDEYGEYSMNKSNPVAYGTEVTLTYTPNAGYENYVATWSVNGTPISGNKFTMPDADVTITVNLAEIFDMTLSNGDIVAAGDAADSYASYPITDTNGKTWNAYAIKKAHSGPTSSYHFLQIKKYASSTAYYIQVPEYGRKITKLEMTVSNSSQPMTGGGNGATLYFSASNSTSATGTGVASGTGASKVTIDCSDLNLNTGYITAGGAVRIWDVKVTYDPIRLNGSGYATYAGLTPIDYSDDSKFSAWAIASITGDAITFSKITSKVPAGTGVLLMGTAGQAVEPVVAASGTAPTTNLLEGKTTATTVTADQYYGLSGKKFVKVNAGTVPAGRALLPASAIPPATARELNFVFDDETTGISAIENMEPTTENAVIYNLNGQRVANPGKGLYIVNGKKVIMK